MNLEKKLALWQSAQLMTAPQAAAIQAYEEKNATSSSWVAWGIACVGVSAILLGLLAIIGVNWHLIPASLKLGGAFGGFAVLLGLVKLSLTHKHRDFLMDILMVVWQGYTLACIALIGQIYNLQGPLWQTLLFWVVLIFPTVLISKRFIVNIIWLGLATLTVFASISNDIFESQAIKGLWLATPFLYLILTDATRNTPFFDRFTIPLRMLGWVGFLINWVISQEFLIGNNSRDPHGIALLLGTMGILLAVTISKRNISSNNKSVLLSALTLYTLTLVLTRHAPLPEMLDHLISLSLIMLMAIYAAQQHRKRLFNLLTLLAVVRLVILYVALAGSLLVTGFGLISTGVLILGLLYGWYKYRTQLLEKFGK